ncbi:MAG: Dam family site-specific DNA-(adenine-N6)-methyltransferase [Erysipelotrichaceae bacterium]
MKTFDISNRRYLGSKSKLINFIHEVVDENCKDVGSILDVFGGTGIVGYSFNKQCSIMVNDILKTNLVAYDTFFSNKKISLKKLQRIILEFNETQVENDNYYSINFADTYLSKNNMQKIGFIRDQIDDLYLNKKINKREKSILICSLLYSIDKIANTVGHYDAYRKNGDLDQLLNMQVPNLCLEEFNKNNHIYNENSNDLVKNVYADLVYIDPPYNSRQYCDAYHFLENVALNQKTDVFGTAKKMSRDKLKSKYCTSKAPNEFADLIENINSKYILVSYNNTGEKGNARSNAKISDNEILSVLKRKGEVKVFEQDFNVFTTGKTRMANHKERLFLCTVGKKAEIKVANQDCLVKSPLNYTGGKYKILDQLLEKIPNDIALFLDVFSGGGNVGINIESNKIVCIDKEEKLISLFKYLQKQDYYELVKRLDELSKKFCLSNTFKNGYEYYGCNSANGVGIYNKTGFLKLREYYNNSKDKKDELFLMLLIYSFNNQIRFNNQGNFNLPVGKRDFNASLRKKLKLFMNKLNDKNISFINLDFRDIDLDKISGLNSFLYLDPPYFLGTASYNENGGWTERDEEDLLDFLKQCNEKQIRFALSNVIEHKGKTHKKLLDWCLNYGFNINYINCSYKNSNYHIKDKTAITREVLITNY